MEKKEEQLIEAAEKYAIDNSNGCTYDNHTFDCLCSAREEGFIAGAKQCHSSNDSVDQAFKRGYYEANEHLQKQQESDAVDWKQKYEDLKQKLDLFPVVRIESIIKKLSECDYNDSGEIKVMNAEKAAKEIKFDILNRP